jgi:hypothetical protein
MTLQAARNALLEEWLPVFPPCGGASMRSHRVTCPPPRSSIRITCGDDPFPPRAVGIPASFNPAGRFSRPPVNDPSPACAGRASTSIARAFLLGTRRQAFSIRHVWDGPINHMICAGANGVRRPPPLLYRDRDQFPPRSRQALHCPRQTNEDRQGVSAVRLAGEAQGDHGTLARLCDPRSLLAFSVC